MFLPFQQNCTTKQIKQQIAKSKMMAKPTIVSGIGPYNYNYRVYNYNYNYRVYNYRVYI